MPWSCNKIDGNMTNVITSLLVFHTDNTKQHLPMGFSLTRYLLTLLVIYLPRTLIFNKGHCWRK